MTDFSPFILAHKHYTKQDAYQKEHTVHKHDILIFLKMCFISSHGDTPTPLKKEEISCDILKASDHFVIKEALKESRNHIFSSISVQV